MYCLLYQNLCYCSFYTTSLQHTLLGLRILRFVALLHACNSSNGGIHSKLDFTTPHFLSCSTTTSDARPHLVCMVQCACTVTIVYGNEHNER